MSAEQLNAIRKHLVSALGTVDVMLAALEGPVAETPVEDADPTDPAPVDPAPEEPTGPAPVDPVPEPPSDPIPDPDPTPDPDPVPAPTPGGTPITTEDELKTALANAGDGAILPVRGNFPPMDLRKINVGGVVIRGLGATFGKTMLYGCSGLIFQAIDFVQNGPVAASGATPYLLMGDNATSNIVVDGCDFFGDPAASDFRNWTKADWQRQKIGAAIFHGDNIALRGSHALAVNFGFNLTGLNGVMENLRVCGFSGDAFRTCGSGLRAKGLWATDAYVIDSNHPDGIQGFDRSNTLSDQVIEDVILMEYSTPTDQRGLLGAACQLLGYHDAPYADITFRRIVGAGSSFNAYHIGGCANHIGDRIMLWSIPGPKGGQSKTRVMNCTGSLTKVYTDRLASGSMPNTGKPDYSKLPGFQVPAVRGATRPDIDQIIGW